MILDFPCPLISLWSVPFGFTGQWLNEGVGGGKGFLKGRGKGRASFPDPAAQFAREVVLEGGRGIDVGLGPVSPPPTHF